MKYYHTFFLFFLSLTVYSQSNCDDANAYLVNAYSHVKDAYDSNNVSHLKYYANRSVESFKLSKKTLPDCGCKTALDLTDKAIELLIKVEAVETFEDGRFYVKRARDISKESVIEIDKCSINMSTSNNIDDQEEELSGLQQEQLKLKQQQEALKLKEEDIKNKLAQQKEKELMLEKQQLILSYKSAIASNIKTFNETLKACNCNYNAFKTVDDSNHLLGQSIEKIKTAYKNNLKKLASNYLDALNACK